MAAPDSHVFEQPGGYARSLARDASPSFISLSSPGTPASLDDSGRDDFSSASSPSPRRNVPEFDARSKPSPLALLPADLPPHGSLRKKPPSRLNLHQSTVNRNLDSAHSSPAPSPWLAGRFTPTGSPALAPVRPPGPPSPLSSTPPRPLAPSPDVSPKLEPAASHDSEPYAPASAFLRRARGMTVGAPAALPASQLKPSTSIPDLASAPGRGVSSTYRPERGPLSREHSMAFRKEPALPWVDNAEARGSVRSIRSAWTNVSALTYESSALDNSETERSSITSFEVAPKSGPREDEMTVEDAINMYAEFEIDDDLERSVQYENGHTSSNLSTKSEEKPQTPPKERRYIPETPHQSGLSGLDISPPSSLPLDRRLPETQFRDQPPSPISILDPASPGPFDSPPKDLDAAADAAAKQSPLRLNPVPSSPGASPPLPPPKEAFTPEPRDRYGFKKATRDVSVAQYDVWNAGYTEYLERRRKKWDVVMKQYGLSTDHPIRFPPKSDKVKRYVRKGIPPDWRGAAWFWYAGGPDRLAREPGLYRQLVGKAQQGHLSETDKDIIERDLNRTFPDNIRFKPDPIDEVEPVRRTLPGRDIRPVRTKSVDEPRILGALRRVLQAFAIHNTSIGYCQSLNFLAGLLLLFLNEDEEKTFILLNIITNTHLPGAHAKVLESNVDIGVLLSCIQESMPAVWAMINDVDEQGPGLMTATGPPRGRSGGGGGGGGTSAQLGTRLPTVSLVLTAWFMSCFVTALPTESVLRVWDALFYEGSKTLFRIGLAIFKLGEPEIRAIRDPLEVFQVVQAVPRRLLDCNSLLEATFKRRNGFGHVSQDTIDARRRARRDLVRRDREEAAGAAVAAERGRSTAPAGRRRPGVPADEPPLPPLPLPLDAALGEQARGSGAFRSKAKRFKERSRSKSRKNQRGSNKREAEEGVGVDGVGAWLKAA